MLILPTKDPDEVLTYTIDWTERLAGDTLAGAPVVTPTGITLDSQSNTPTSVTVKLSGGTAGTIAKVQARGVTAAGLTIEDTAVLLIGFDAVTLADAKADQKIETDGEDALLTGFLRAAIGHVEKRTSKNLQPKIVTQVVSGFPSFCGGPQPSQPGVAAGAIRLWQGPVSDVLSIAYDDANGVEQALTSFRLVEGVNAKLLPAFGATWPVTAPGPGTVRIAYVAGYDVGEMPPELGLAALFLFGHFNANREAVTVGASAAAIELPLGFEMLISSYCSPGIY